MHELVNAVENGHSQAFVAGVGSRRFPSAWIWMVAPCWNPRLMRLLTADAPPTFPSNTAGGPHTDDLSNTAPRGRAMYSCWRCFARCFRRSMEPGRPGGSAAFKPATNEGKAESEHRLVARPGFGVADPGGPLNTLSRSGEPLQQPPSVGLTGSLELAREVVCGFCDLWVLSA